MKLLFISNITGKKVGSFAMASILAAKELEFEYHLAANFRNSTPEQMKSDEEEYGIHLHQIDFERNPLNPANRKAYRQIIKLIGEEQIDAIHCNTPIGGVVGRLAGKKCKVGRVIYQAHGFHFYKGAPLINWLVYYPIERILAHYTDTLITINHEDYERAQKFHLRNNGKVYYVPGVGIDTSEYKSKDFQRKKKREELGLKEEDVMVVSAGDLIERKNYKTSIEAIKQANNPCLQYYICGKGPLQSELEKLTKELGIEKQIHFLGFRSDVKELLWAADIFLFTTLQEGLPRSLSEAMACGLPCLASNIRGNNDLIIHGENGYLFKPTDVLGFSEGLNKLAADRNFRISFGSACETKIADFSIAKTQSAIEEIYRKNMLNAFGR